MCVWLATTGRAQGHAPPAPLGPSSPCRATETFPSRCIRYIIRYCTNPYPFCDTCSCQGCPLGKYCIAGSVNSTGACPSTGFDCSSGVLTQLEGYWSQVSNSTLISYPCLNPGACSGWSYSGLVQDEAFTVATLPHCAKGYTGPLCASCEQGWASLGGSKCLQCANKALMVVGLALIGFFVLTVISLLVAIVTQVATRSSPVRSCGSVTDVPPSYFSCPTAASGAVAPR